MLPLRSEAYLWQAEGDGPGVNTGVLPQGEHVHVGYIAHSHMSALRSKQNKGLNVIYSRDSNPDVTVFPDVPTHCSNCGSLSLMTAQLVRDSSSVGHRAACMNWNESREM